MEPGVEAPIMAARDVIGVEGFERLEPCPELEELYKEGQGWEFEMQCALGDHGGDSPEFLRASLGEADVMAKIEEHRRSAVKLPGDD
jgi:hypothetical protein